MQEKFLKEKAQGYFDTNLIQREYHNRNKFPVIFERDTKKDPYVFAAKKTTGPLQARVEPDEFLYLPHGYYFIRGEGVPQGEPINMLVNYEKAMFKRNKKASDHFGF